MNESRRMTYLGIMGVDTYVSRFQLPGAAPTVRRVVNRMPPAATALPAAEDSQPPPAVLQELNAQLPTPEIAPAELRPTPADVMDTPLAAELNAIASPFSVALIGVGGWLWLEELVDGRGEPSRAQVSLIQSIVFALGWDREPVDVVSFVWPIHTNAQLDLSEEAASSSLESFVVRKLDESAYRGVILLGDACRPRVRLHRLPLEQLTATVSSAEMLANPQLKRQAWRDLSALSRHA